MKISAKWIRALFLAVACSVGLSSSVAAQFGVGAIGGTVTDESGGVLPGVTVTLSNPGVIGGDQSTVSDANGAYQFTRLVPGKYGVKGELQGFRVVLQQGIEVNADRTSRVDIKMAGIPVLRRGQPLDFNERAASNKLLAEHVPLVVDLHAGKAMARYWTCDFTAEYVRINASYRT